MDFKLENKNVLITAASSGIGKAAAELFMDENCNVAICSSSLENIKRSADEISAKYGKKILPLQCDINNAYEIEKTVKSVEEKFGNIDILVNNCGGPAPGYFDDMNDDLWKEGYDQVLMSAVRFTRLVIPNMKKNNWGRIINITSISVKEPIDNLLLSNVFRSGLTAFAKTLSNEVGKFNITINNVAPGYTLTPRLEQLAKVRSKELGIEIKEFLNQMSENIPLKRVGSPKEIASAAVYFASEQAAYITGQTLVVDGGKNKSTY